MTNLIIIAIVAAIFGMAVRYIYKAKKGGCSGTCHCSGESTCGCHGES